MLTKNLDARHSMSLSSTTKVYHALIRGKRSTFLLSMFVKLRGTPRGLRSIFALPSRKLRVIGGVDARRPSLRTIGTSHPSRSSYFFNPGMVRLYHLTSVAFLNLRNKRKRGKGLRTSFSLLNVGCAKPSSLKYTITVRGNITGRVFLRSNMSAPKNKAVCGGSRSRSCRSLNLALPIIIGPYSNNSDVKICVMGASRRCTRTLGGSFRCRSRLIIRPCVGNHRFTYNVVSKATLPPVRVVPGAKFFSCTGGCRSKTASRMYPTSVPRRITRHVGRLAMGTFGTLGLGICDHTSFLLSTGNGLFYLRVGALPKVASTDLLPGRTGICKVRCNSLYRLVVGGSVRTECW